MDLAMWPEHETFIRRRVESGRNQDGTDVIRKALQSLSERDRDRAELRDALAVGLDQIERGETVAWTPGFLPRLLDEAEEMIATDQRARERGER